MKNNNPSHRGAIKRERSAILTRQSQVLQHQTNKTTTRFQYENYYTNRGGNQHRQNCVFSGWTERRAQPAVGGDAMIATPDNIAFLNDEELNRICKLLCTKYASWVRVVARNPGILTHELPAMLRPSNNPAAISRMLNRKLLPLGLQIEKRALTKHTESWGWYLIELPSRANEAA